MEWDTRGREGRNYYESKIQSLGWIRESLSVHKVILPEALLTYTYRSFRAYALHSEIRVLWTSRKPYVLGRAEIFQFYMLGYAISYTRKDIALRV